MVKREKEQIDIGPFSELEVVCHFPKENSKEVIKDIAKGMDYLGFFDNLVN